MDDADDEENRCGAHGGCRRPPTLKVKGVRLCDRHWELRCAAEEQAWTGGLLTRAADDPVHLDYLTQLHGGR